MLAANYLMREHFGYAGSKTVASNKEKEMSMFGVVIMCVFAVISFAVMNKGPMDKEFEKRQAHWARFEGI